MTTTLSTTITRVAYPPATSDADAWYILITPHGCAKGRMSWRPREGEALILDGEWTAYKGEREFAFKSARLDVPTQPRDQLHYVVTRTPGMGPAMEQIIWDAAGDRWQQLKEGEVPRLSGRMYAEFLVQLEALHQNAEQVKVVSALMGKGATANMAQAAWDRWERETLGVVNADPYRLSELAGYGFGDVDKSIRRAYGINDDDERRIRAAVVCALRRLTDRGDTLVVWDDLFNHACGMLGGYADLISDSTAELFKDGTLKAFPGSEGVALASDWNAENLIWQYVENINVAT